MRYSDADSVILGWWRFKLEVGLEGLIAVGWISQRDTQLQVTKHLLVGMEFGVQPAIEGTLVCSKAHVLAIGRLVPLKRVGGFWDVLIDIPIC